MCDNLNTIIGTNKPRILQSVQNFERTDGQKRFRGQWKHVTKTNVTAREWLNKLKRYSAHTRSAVQHAISDVLFKADMGHYNMGLISTGTI